MAESGATALRNKLWQVLAGVVFLGGALGVYFVAQQHPLLPTHSTALPIDDAIPLVPSSIFLYLSPYLVGVATVAFFSAETFRAVVLRGVIAVGPMLVIFFVWPTSVARPPAPPGDDLALTVLRLAYAIDSPPGNAAPSAHVALAVLMGWAEVRTFPRARLLVWLWVAGVLVSVLLTKQHHVIDLVLGALFVAGALWLAPRIERRREATR